MYYYNVRSTASVLKTIRNLVAEKRLVHEPNQPHLQLRKSLQDSIWRHVDSV